MFDDASVLQRGDTLGRYTVLEPVGAGGMGVVYAAYDPDLDRKVALKLLRLDVFDPSQAQQSGTDREEESRLLREAKALASVSHPNIVTVYDTGTFDEQMFIAMEFIEGSTLGEWQNQARTDEVRPWREVLKVFAEAGRGLAAAHRAGLVHRDFKPGNVMIGGDGRVRVLDFGLCDLDTTTDARPAEGGNWTVPAGTPAYIAPEQALGHKADARSDQFSFCCALYESLYGNLPFAGDSVQSYLAQAKAGAVLPPTTGSAVPRWVWEVVSRGLAPTPAQRYLSMDALVAILESDPDSRRRRRRASLFIGLTALIVGAAAWQFASRPLSLCRGAEDQLDGIWDKHRRGLTHRAFLDSQVSYAPESYRETAHLLDAYSRDWIAMRTEACEATHLRGEQSPQLLDLRMDCLDDRLQELKEVTDLLTEADADVVQKAVSVAGQLRRLEPCADRSLLTTILPIPDAETRQQVTRIRGDLARTQALRVAGRFEQGLVNARQADADAQRLGFAPLVAESRFQLAELLRRHDALDEAETALIEAIQFAEQGWHEEMRIWALLSLVWVADSRGSFPEGRRWLRVAEGALHRMKEASDLDHRWHHVAARIELGMGDYEAAATAALTALQGGEDLHGHDHPNIAPYLSTLTLVRMRQGRDEEALRYAERLAAIRLLALGAKHPETGAANHAVGSVLRRLGRLTEAEPVLQRALDSCIEGFGATSSAVAIVRSDLGALLIDLGRFAEAHDEFRQMLEIFRSIYGDEHFEVSRALTQLGLAQLHLDRFTEAEQTLRDALRITLATTGERRSAVAYVLVHQGNLNLRWQRFSEALTPYREARAIVEETLGQDHPLWAQATCGLGEAEEGLGRYEQAISELKAALDRSELHNPALLAQCRFALARALWQQGTERMQSFKLARQARDGYVALGRTDQPTHRRVTDWLAAREEKDP